jgi:hypothetical protein
MPAKIRDIDRMLCRKLKASVEEGTRHTKYRILADDETLLATTQLSRSYTEIDNTLLGPIGRQLSVSIPQLRLLIDCTWTREQYIWHVLG